MIQRKRILRQSGIFLKQNPGETHLTMEKLCDIAASNSTDFLTSIFFVCKYALV